MFVKFCGFTRPEDIEAAAALGVSAVGFIFYKKSLRCISREKARVLCRQLRGTNIRRVGIFIDASIFEIAEICTTTGLDSLQLYDCRLIDELRGFRPIIAAYRIGGYGGLEKVPQPQDDDLILLDSRSETAFGGTGEHFDWSGLSDYPCLDKTIVAGGVNAGNIQELLSAVRPYGVDICSGIEEAPGIKSAEKMVQFMHRIGNDNYLQQHKGAL